LSAACVSAGIAATRQKATIGQTRQILRTRRYTAVVNVLLRRIVSPPVSHKYERSPTEWSAEVIAGKTSCICRIGAVTGSMPISASAPGRQISAKEGTGAQNTAGDAAGAKRNKWNSFRMARKHQDLPDETHNG
jgi:hypothetical protein